MVVRITINVLRVAALLALILGILDWVGYSLGSILIHMVLGFLVVISLWILGGVMLTRKTGAGLGIGAIVLGLLVLALGLTQKQILPEPNPAHWVIQVVHLLFGLSAIGIGEMIGGRIRRQQRVATMQAR
ncbi:MAG TPA: hypothetical protein VGT82_03875 [Ktedonobacteraceae bacterium]|nr:hypothetical protein [Ktedonobacteraceae bacterium]